VRYPLIIMQVLDNFLNYQDHQQIEQFMFGGLQWTYQQHKVTHGPNEEDTDNYQFVHPFYFQESFGGPFRYEISQDFQSILPLINRIDFIALHKVKANLEPLKSKRFFSDYHYDWAEVVHDEPIPHKTMTTAIYYINTCDGYTEFEDGTKIECVANRLVKFPANLKHRGVSQTDTRVKSVINLNFFE